MEVGVVGINHKTSPLQLREKISKAMMRSFEEEKGFSRVILSTCNRTEVYFSGEDLPQIHSLILHHLRERVEHGFEHQLYSYFYYDCFRHLSEVTAGLDSAILAESDIQRQVKLAYMKASFSEDLPGPLHFMFQKSLKIGKTIRSLFPEMRPKMTLEQILYSLQRNFFRNEKNLSVLMIGNSQINRKILAYFRHKQGFKITLCTRGLSAAKELIEKYGIKVAPWEEIKNWQQFQLVIAGSHYPDYLIRSEHILGEVTPALMIDLSIPRNIDPALANHPSIQLFNVDEISHLINQNKYRHFQEMMTCFEKIEEEVAKQIVIYHKKTSNILACASF